MRRLGLAALSLLLTMPAAWAIEGRYRVEGKMPGDKTYGGEALIRKDNEVYLIAWRTNMGRHVGTAILNGDVLSVVYRDQAGKEQPGVASLAVVANRVAQGRWSTIATNTTGVETWSFLGE